MRIVIVGGGIVAAYMANAIKEQSPAHEVLIVTKESHPPYDRIHLCALISGSADIDEIALPLPPGVKVELNAEVRSIDKAAKRIYTASASYAYDKLVIATGSTPRTLFDIKGIANAATFRSADDCECIAHRIVGRNVVMMGVGPIGLELLDTLTSLDGPEKIYLVSRGEHLYDKVLTPSATAMMKRIYEAADPRVEILLEDEITEKVVENGEITRIVMRSRTIENPFVIFGVGIAPAAGFVKGTLDVDKGILVDEYMHTSDPDIYAVGEVAQMPDGYVAGRVKECTMQADAAVTSLLGMEGKGFREFVTIDGLKVGAFLLADVTSTAFDPKDEKNEDIVIASKSEERIDQYIVNGNRLVRFIGINTNIDVMALKRMMEQNKAVDPAFFFSNRLVSERGRLVCSCTSSYEQDLVALIKEHCIADFADLKSFSEAGRVCGRCKKDVAQLIADTPVDPEEAARLKAEREAAAKAEEMAQVQRRIEKFNALHPANRIDGENLAEALKAFDMSHEFNRWVSMITAGMRLHPDYEPLVGQSVEQLNKIPIIWLELADCSGNSEASLRQPIPR